MTFTDFFETLGASVVVLLVVALCVLFALLLLIARAVWWVFTLPTRLMGVR